ncbi:unnamed protein product [Schistosoma mattheei]|uniref:Uncharacterized protein n=1 Tax=Schistosoma mattheei TaxID=31246 RepID=A0A183P878_9TREM|nr:unnamed protein product [Schistosoma mattheei]
MQSSNIEVMNANSKCLNSDLIPFIYYFSFPVLSGYIIDLTQSHDPAFIISGLGMVLAAFSVVPIIIQHFRRRRARRLRRLQQNCSEIVLEAQT